jgi:hypothetical protein
MFVQVIKGQVEDPAAMRAAMERWTTELAPGATGWLGSTTGVTDDGTFVALARFDSEDNARRNSDRPEQGAWWAELERLFTGDPSFADSVDVDVDLAGDPDTAAFVQVMQGRVSDPERVRELLHLDAETWSSYRPELLGTVTAMHEDKAYTLAAYFTSEAEAREGEQKEPPEAIRNQMAEAAELFVGDTVYYDLREPWLDAPR